MDCPWDVSHGDEDPVRSGLHAAAQRRLEAEEDERLAAIDELRTRGLPDVARALCVRRRLVEVDVGSRRFTGRVLAVGSDWAAVATAGGTVDVRLAGPVAIRELGGQPPAETSSSRSPSPEAAARTFGARLAQLELAGGVVEIGTHSVAISATGRLQAAARDHVVIIDSEGASSYVAGVAWVRSHA